MTRTDDNHLRIRELEVERLVLREPNGGRIRAVIETGPSRDPDLRAPVLAVRLTLLDPAGQPAVVAEVDGTGEATVFVGHPDHGDSIVLAPHAVDVWSKGNIVSSLPSDE